MQTSTPAIFERERAPSKYAGFTLIELTLVVLILGVLLTLTLPRLALLGEQRLDSAARRLAVLISYLHDESALRGRIYRLTLDLDRENYRVEVERPYAKEASAHEFSEEWDPYARASQLPEGVDIVAVDSATARLSTGSASLYFMPENDLAAVTITLAGSDGEEISLAVDATSGNVTRSYSPRPDQAAP